MKNILIVSGCGKRRDTIGLIGSLLASFENLDKTKYHISLLDTDFFERNHQPSDYKVDCYYALENSLIDSIIRHIPRIRTLYSDRKAIITYKHILSSNHFDLVVVYQIPQYADKLVEIAHTKQTKIVLEPFGSDILRASTSESIRLKEAFSKADGVVGRAKSNVMIAAQELYNVPEEKLKVQREYVRGIKLLKSLSGKLSRSEMHESIGIPTSKYNIVCGYSGRESHRHSMIINALIQVKDVLPEGYQIIFPMTYGAGEHHEIIINYANKLKEVCDGAGLNTVFMTDYKTAEQMALLHLITDLFIEIQPTDNGNAFMIEALFARNKIVTGRWLNYKKFEQFGIPYYLLDNPEDLPSMLRRVFTHQIEEAIVPPALVDFFDIPDDYDPSVFWAELFDTL